MEMRPSFGHFGFARTLARIRQHYYWPKLTQDVNHYVKTCNDCQRSKGPPMRLAGFLKPVAPLSQPFQQIGIDWLGSFLKSHGGHHWIVVATDYLAKYCKTRALQRETANEIAYFFVNNIVLRHGAPPLVLTDRGTVFTAQMMQDIPSLSGTTHRNTTAYHPQTNGLMERSHHKKWDDVLPYITFAYNIAVQEATGFIPFRLLHGREAITKLNSMLLPKRCDTTADANVFIRLVEAARKLALERIQNQQRIDSQRYNALHREVIYQPGDQVLLWIPIRQ